MLLETYGRNFKMRHWPNTVLKAFEEPALIVNRFLEQKAQIDRDVNLTPRGRQEARHEAATHARTSLSKWATGKLTGLDAQVAEHRRALVPQTPTPDPRKVDHLVARLQTFTPDEIATFYGSATDEERQLIEAASASIGRIPTKTPNGLTWEPLVSPEAVHESILARATAQNPVGVAKYNELTEIRAMHVTVAQHAEREIAQALTH
jgi:hypothetical protein